ncbi:abortive infection family protein [Burkholderia sp. AU31624]|uniref:Abortive phage resistance protein n=1 Tax=Burkholderia contaminans TaxID=488447 RepID=A0A3N8R8U5_9BURK|nr:MULTISPECIES: abortive infection family protein [Burkholderia]MCA8255450.1 abortive infection family protein [Burkholderia sp. AU31624]RQT32348.1 abortive phage resistance protein [Burkholderia contaminans]
MSDEAFDAIEGLQNHLINVATGGVGRDPDYRSERTYLLERPGLAHLVPRFVKTCRSTGEFWQFIKHKFPTYQERRTYIWDEFRPLLDYLEAGGNAPADQIVSAAIDKFDAQYIKNVWTKALERRETDPEGAITSARTLLESVCKHILDETATEYPETPELNKLYGLTAKALNLSPSQHTEPVFKQILGGCTSVVEGLGAVRNRLGDSHGKGKVAVKPAPRHAELAVNLAGSVALFLLATLESRSRK